MKMLKRKDLSCFFLIAVVLLTGLLVYGEAGDSQNPGDISGEALPKFTDVTHQAGIKFKHTNGESGQFYMPETYGSGAAFFDYNNDGYLDIYLVNGTSLSDLNSKVKPTNVLYRNNGDGTFTDVTAEAGVGDTGYGVGCVAGDYDNDGDQDLYVCNFGPNVLYRNNGDGTFTDVTDLAGVGNELWSFAGSFFDYDNDGDLDLYVINYVDFSVENNKKCYIAEGIRDYCGPDSYNGVPNVLYRNNGDGTFTEVTKEAGLYNPEGKAMGVAIGDYDNDGDLDIFVSNDRVANFLYQNNGDGTFTEVALFAGVAYNEDGIAMGGMGADMGDYDNDGDLDIFLTHYSFQANSLFRNEGDGFFTYETFTAGLGELSFLKTQAAAKFFDYDNDGYLDIFASSGDFLKFPNLRDKRVRRNQRNQLYRNNGDGTFTEVSAHSGRPFSKPGVYRAAAFGDYDNDGDIDILITTCNGAPVLLRNDGGNRNNWLMLKTIGTKSNRDGIGARVEVVTGSFSQIREVVSGGSYESDHDRRVHFGLGKFKKADLVKVKWPSGLVDEARDVAANQLLVIQEGKGIIRKISFEE